MNIIVDTPANINPITFKLHSSKIDSNDNRNLHLYTLLFGNKKSSDWLHNFLYLINTFEITKTPGLITKVKFITILLYTISYNLLVFDLKNTKKLISSCFLSNNSSKKNLTIEKLFEKTELSWELQFGYNILHEFFEIIKFYLTSFAKDKENNNYVKLFFEEINNSLLAFIQMVELEQSKDNFDVFFNLRIQRLNAKVILLIELALAEDEITSIMKAEKINLEEIMSFGKYIEINATLVRDYSRKSESNPLNTYCYYKKYYDEKNYFSICEDEKKSLLKKFCSNDLLMSLLKKFENNFSKYYTEKNDSKDEVVDKNTIKPKF